LWLVTVQHRHADVRVWHGY